MFINVTMWTNTQGLLYQPQTYALLDKMNSFLSSTFVGRNVMVQCILTLELKVTAFYFCTITKNFSNCAKVPSFQTCFGEYPGTTKEPARDIPPPPQKQSLKAWSLGQVSTVLQNCLRWPLLLYKFYALFPAFTCSHDTCIKFCIIS